MTKSSKKKIKYKPFKWTDAKEKTFEDLKHIFITAPILEHYDSFLETWIETNVSDFVVAKVLLQMYDRVLKLMVYYSKKMNLAEYNYIIYNKKLLVIVRSFKT